MLLIVIPVSLSVLGNSISLELFYFLEDGIKKEQLVAIYDSIWQRKESNPDDDQESNHDDDQDSNDEDMRSEECEKNDVDEDMEETVRQGESGDNDKEHEREMLVDELKSIFSKAEV